MSTFDVARIEYDTGAFEAFYREHVEAVLGFVTRRVSDPHLAADLTADVFLAAIDAAAGYRADRGEPGAWLFGIARNVVHTELRRATRERELGRRIHGHELLDSDDVERLQQRIDAQARTRRLYEALDALPASERAVFELHAIDGLEPAEAARVLGIRPGAARVRLHRARTALQRHMAEADAGETATLLSQEV